MDQTTMASGEEFLEHHGVRGMHWGVRKSRTATRPSSDHKQSRDLKSRPVSTLTNKQLKDLNNRLNMEQQLARLNPGPVHVGKKQVEVVMATIGTAATVYNLVNSPFGKSAINLGKRMMAKKGA